MLFDQIEKQYPEGFPLFLFRQHLGNVTRHRISSSGTDFPVDPGELILGQSDRNLRPRHTSIIPPVSRPPARPSAARVFTAGANSWTSSSTPAFCFEFFSAGVLFSNSRSNLRSELGGFSRVVASSRPNASMYAPKAPCRSAMDSSSVSSATALERPAEAHERQAPLYRFALATASVGALRNAARKAKLKW